MATCRLKSWLELAKAAIMSPATVALECSSECSCGRNDRRGFRPGGETQALPGPELPRAQIVVPQKLGRAFEPGFFLGQHSAWPAMMAVSASNPNPTPSGVPCCRGQGRTRAPTPSYSGNLMVAEHLVDSIAAG